MFGAAAFQAPSRDWTSETVELQFAKISQRRLLGLALAVTSASFLSARGWLVVLLKVRLFVFDLGLLHVEAGRPQIEFKHPHYTIKEKQDCSVRRTMCAP